MTHGLVEPEIKVLHYQKFLKTISLKSCYIAAVIN